MNERQIFEEALAITDPARRQAFLDRACGGDAALRHGVGALLAAHAPDSQFLQVPAFEQLAEGELNTGVDTVMLQKGKRAGDDECDDEVPLGPDLGFLQPSSKPGSIGMLGHYEILQLLGQGGFGIVFKAFDEKLHRLVAIKAMNPQMAATSPPRKRFLREARAAAAIKHENVVQVYSVEEQPLPYMAMEYIEGQTLQQKLDGAGPLEAAEILHIGRQIASGLAAAHALGLIHRDIKPGNILLEQGAEQKVKITDFGLARAADDATLTRTGVVSGTPLYMSPEQATGAAIDLRSDLFSLGSVLYVMASGRPPFRAPNVVAVLKRVVDDTPRPIAEIIPEVPAWLCQIIAKLHAKSPEDRFASAKDVADLLARCQADLQANRPVELPAELRPAEQPPVEPEGSAGSAAPTAVANSEVLKLPTPAVEIQRPSRRQPRRWPAVAATLLVLFMGLGFTEATGVTQLTSTVIRLTTGSGTLVIETDDPGVKVTIDGEEVRIQGAGVEQLTLKPGQYQVAAVKNGKPVTQQLVTITRGGREVVKVTLEGIASVNRTTTPSSVNGDAPDRRAAEWVLSNTGNAISINGLAGRWGGALHKLPKGKFTLTGVEMAWNPKVTDAGMVHFHGCKNLVDLYLAHNPVSDEGLSYFKDCHNLMYLTLDQIQASDEGLAHFQNCKKLKRIYLCGMAIFDAGLAHFKGCDDLADLTLDNLQISEAGLAHFKNCKNLTSLRLRGRGVDDSGLSHFKNCNKLITLDLVAATVTDAGLANVEACKNLKVLNLERTKLSNAGLERLTAFLDLSTLQVRGTTVTEAGVQKLAAALPRCQIIWDGGVIEPLPPTPDRTAAEYVLSIGGSVRIKENGTERDVGAVAELPRGAFELTSVNLLGNPKVTDVGLANFKDCKNLTGLVLHNIPVTDAGLAYFQDCKNLTSLHLNKIPVTDAGLAYFQDCKNLTQLILDQIPVTDAGLACFQDCKNLTELVLQGTQVSNAGLAHFRDCKDLTHLSLGGSQVSDAGLAYFQDCRNLSHLNLSDTQVSDAGLAYFQDCEKLGSLIFVYDERISHAGLAHFKDCRNLTQLILNHIRATDAGLAYFKECKNLTELSLIDTQVTDAGLAHFQGCKNVTKLNLGDNRVSDAGLAHFQDCKKLTELVLQGTLVSDAGLAHFKDCKSYFIIQLDATQVSDACLADLASQPHLGELSLHHTRISLRGYEQLKTALLKSQITWSETNRSVAEGVLALGGTVEIGTPGQAESRPVAAATDLPAEFFQVRRVSLAGVSKPLGELTGQMSWLQFPEFDRLQSLDLSGIAGQNYAFLTPIDGLQELTLANAGLTDDALAQLPKLPALKRLVLDGNDIRGTGLKALAAQPELTDLSLGCPSLGDLLATNLAELKPIKRLSLAGSGLGDAGIKHLAGLTNLESLDLRKTKVTAAGVAALQTALPKCKITSDVAES